MLLWVASEYGQRRRASGGKPLDLLGWYRGYVDVKRDGEPQPVALPVQADDGGDRRAGLPAFASDAARVSAP
jgi:hypothetical protein